MKGRLTRWLVGRVDRAAARQIDELRRRLARQKEATRRAEWEALTNRNLAERWRSIAWRSIGDTDAETR